jgi:hypothetical protein
MNVDTQQDRRSALDRFAESVERPPAVLSSAAAPEAFDRVHGAQPVAVHRDLGRIMERLRVLAAAAGSDWYYRYPVRNRKENRTDWIEGPSIKLANDLSREYGNCDIDCRAQDLGDQWLLHARFVDLESGYSLTRPFQARKTTSRIGGDDDGRRADSAFSIAVSKAIRNVVCNALQTFADFAFEEAKNALVERIGKDLAKYREETIKRVSARVDLKRVEAVVGRAAKDWLAPDVARVIAMMKAVTDGMSSLDETFPPLENERKAADLDAFANSPSESRGDNGEDSGKRKPTSSPPADDDKGAASSSSSADPERRQEVIDKMMALATDTTLNVEQRIETLDGVLQDWIDQMPDDEDFVRTCVETAMKVVTGETKADQARKYLGGLKGK